MKRIFFISICLGIAFSLCDAYAQNPQNAVRQPGNVSGIFIVGNVNSSRKTPFINSVIRNHARFTNTFVTCSDEYRNQDFRRFSYRSYYVISHNDGNLYRREWDGEKYVDETLILKDVKEINAINLSNYSNAKTSFFALKNDGSLWGWGDNSAGQLGDNTGINKMTPVKILDNVREFILVRGGSVFAVKNDGTAYAWGKNQKDYGLGLGDSEDRFAPAKLPVNNVLYAGDLSYYKSHVTGNSMGLISVSGDEYRFGLWYNDGNKRYGAVPELVGKFDYSVNVSDYNQASKTFTNYKLLRNGALYRENDLFASNITFITYSYLINIGYGISGSSGPASNTGSYIANNGDLYVWGDAPVGDGTNIPRKNPVHVLKYVIQSDPVHRYALTAAGKLYSVDKKNPFKYSLVASDAYLLVYDNITGSMNTHLFGFFSNDGRFYTLNYDKDTISVFLKDVALPVMKK